LYGGIPFDREVKFDTGATRAMILEDLIQLFGTMETIRLSPMVSQWPGFDVRWVGGVFSGVCREFMLCSGMGLLSTPGYNYPRIPDNARPGIYENL
jgi:hypothetical protein